VGALYTTIKYNEKEIFEKVFKMGKKV